MTKIDGGRVVVLGLGCLLAGACSADVASTAPDAGGGDAAVADAHGGASDGGPGDAGVTCTPTDGGGPAPSTQTVRFDVTNTSSATVFVAAEGSHCSPYEVRSGAGPLALVFNGWPECEGPPPPPGSVTRWQALAPGATAAITWDARAQVRSSYCVDCGARGWSGLRVSEIPTAHPVPAAAGSYTARLGLSPALDPSCTAEGGGEWRCPPLGFGQGQGVYGDAPACETERGVEVTFSLPASGDLVVPVSLP